MHSTPPAPVDYRFFFAELCTKTPSLTAQTSSTDTFIAPPSTAVKLMPRIKALIAIKQTTPLKF